MQYRLHFGALFVAICLGLYRWYGGPQASWSTGFAARRTASHLPYEEFTGTLEQSPTDPRTHRLIRLPNGMVAACVHDPDAANAAAALSVNVGAFSDPPELMGLAHFLEHMLFLGTRKYPAEDEYVAYINGNSGSYNAFTALDTTAYFFEVANGALEGALDRFSQFFIDPLFTPDGVGRELNAVDSEHKGNLQSDGRRLFQLQRLLSRSTHPYSKFSTGNKDTLLGSSQRLGLDIRDEVVRFYNQRYSADIMRFAIVGNYSVEQLVEWTVAQLSSVQSKGDTREKMPVHPLGPNDLGKLVYYETVENKTTLSLQFGLSELKRTYRTMPSRYVVSLVRRKTPGSVFHLLKEKGWATNIQAEIHSLAYDGFNMFDIDIDLTPAGLEHHEDVLRAVLAYLAMLANSGPQKWIHDELRTMRKLEFQFFEKPGASNYALVLSKDGHNEHIAPEHYLTKHKGVPEFSARAISGFMAHLHPGNYRAFLGSRSHSGIQLNGIEEHYGTPYHIADLPPGLTSGQNTPYDFYLPAPNPYIPETTAVLGTVVDRAEVAVAPMLLQKTDAYELWFKQDDQFASPKGNIRLFIEYPHADPTALNTVAAQLLGTCVREALYEELDTAEAAGMDAEIEFPASSIDIDLDGYSDKLPLLLQTIVHKLKTLEINEAMFQESRTLLRQSYQKEHANQPFIQLNRHRLAYLHHVPQWSTATLESHLDSVTIEMVQAFAQTMLEQAYFKLLMVGNFAEGTAMDTARQVQDMLHAEPLLPLPRQTGARIVNVGPGHYHYQSQLLDNSTVNNAVQTIIYCGSRSDARERMAVVLLTHMVKGPFFDQLRTTEQLGYAIMAINSFYKQGRMMLSFITQSETNPAFLTLRIDRFVREIRQHISAYSASDFAALVESQISSRTEKLKGTMWEAERFWSRMKTGEYDFGYVEQDIASLQALSKEDVLAVWDKYVNPETAAGYTRVDLQLWSAKAAYPSSADLEAFAEGAIALYGCLASEGLAGVTLAELDRFVRSVSLADGIEAPLQGLQDLYSSKTDAGQLLLDRITDSTSRIGAALEMAVQTSSMLPSSWTRLPSALGRSSLRKTPAGKLIIADVDSFKATQGLYSISTPATEYVPKYAD